MNIEKIKSQKSNLKNNGSIVLLVLVFGAIFMILLGGTFGFVFTQHNLQKVKTEKERALQISEAGINYYRWFLSHYPDDLTDGTGESGSYEHEYSDPEGGAIGKFSLQVSGVTQCHSVTAIDITSTGWTYEDPKVTRQIEIRYSRPSVADYAYIINDSVWAGADRVIQGKYHSNGGIRMDGQSDSLVTSAQPTWNCTSSFGCSSPYEVKPGVFGDGGDKSLWQFPVQQIDFNGISLDLAQMKTMAKKYSIFLDKPSNGKGYHIIFKDDGTLDVYLVKSVDAVYGYDTDRGWHWDYHVIKSEDFLQNYTPPQDCSLIFAESNLWIEGTVKGKLSVISANLVDPNTDTDIILNGNITYANSDGSDGLLAVGENNVLIPLYSPNQMKLYGIFIAQKGNFGRNYYTCSDYPADCKKTSLEMHGSVVSNKRVGTKWTSGGTFVGGYADRQNSYDRKLMTDPPPLTPFSDDEFKTIKWTEIE